MKIECRLTQQDGTSRTEVIEAASKEEALRLMEKRFGAFKLCEFWELPPDGKPKYLGRARLQEDLDSPPRVSATGSVPASPYKATKDVGEELEVVAKTPRRSYWAIFLRVFGVLVAVVAFSIQTAGPVSVESSMALLNSFLIAVWFFFCAFLVDVFTDIRWLLMVQTTGKNREKDAEA